MATQRRRLQLEGEKITRGALNVLFAEIANRLDRLEGKSGEQVREEPFKISGGAGTNLLVGNLSVNRYGSDLEKVALAAGAYMNSAQQWIALQTIATIIEMDTTQNVKFYFNTGLTPETPYTPTLDYTLAL